MNFGESSGRFVSFVFILLLSLSILSLSATDDSFISEDERFLSKNSSMLPSLSSFGQFGGLNVDFYNLFTSFLNQTRSTVPQIANHGNFSLIQLGLLASIGAMAVGAATIVGEAIVFRQHESDLEYYKAQKANHHGSSSHVTYGAPGGSSGYSSSSQTYGPPSHIDSYASPSELDSYSIPYNSNQIANTQNNNLKRRKKRHTNGMPFPYPQIVKSYDGGSSGHKKLSDLQRLYSNFPIGDSSQLQGASSSINLHKTPFNQGQQQWGWDSGFPSQKQLQRAQSTSSKLRRTRPRDPSNYEESYRGLPLSDDLYEYNQSQRSKKEKRKRKEDLESSIFDYDSTIARSGSNKRKGNSKKIRQDIESFGHYPFNFRNTDRI